MSKQKRPPTSERTTAPEAEQVAPETTVDPALEQQATLGNQALQATISAGREAPGALASTARALAEEGALALRVAPRDPQWTADMVARIERSRLPDARKEAIAERLVADQQLADVVHASVVAHIGADTEALRATLIGALDRVAERAGLEAAEGRSAGAVVGELAVDELGATVEGRETAPAVEGLATALSVLALFGFDEDEDEDLALGDYALEESGG